MALVTTLLWISAISVALLAVLVLLVVWQHSKPMKQVASRLADEKELKNGFSKKKVPEGIDVIVIGSGIGGLTAAAVLSRMGKKVLLLEQHDRLGGTTHTFEEGGFEFDTGVHYLGCDLLNKKMPLRKLFDLVTDGRVEYEPLADDYDVAVFGDERIGWCGAKDGRSGLDRMRERLKTRFPGESEARAIDAYFKLAKYITVLPAGLWIATKILPRFITEPLHNLIARPFYKWSRRTSQAVLDGMTDNKELKACLCYKYGDVGLPPTEMSVAVDLMVLWHYRDGASFPSGGSSMFARAALPVIQSAGGNALVRANVESLMWQDGRVCGVVMERNHLQIRAEYVVSTAGVYNTFTKLLPTPARALVSDAISAMQTGKVSPSIGHFNLFIGLNGTAEELDLPASNFWCFPSFNIVEDREKWFQGEADALGAAFIGFPTAKEPSWNKKYPGKATCVVVSECPYHWVEKFNDARVHHRGEEYEAFKQRIMDTLIALLYRHFPQLEGRIVHKDMGTPVSTNFYIASHAGASYGIAHNPERFEQQWLRSSTKVPGLVLGGQDVLTAGVAGGVLGGFLAAGHICPKAYWKYMRCFF